MQFFDQIMKISSVLIEIIYENVKQFSFKLMKIIFRTKVKN